MTEQEQTETEADICDKLEGWTQEDVGKRIPVRITPNGTYFNEPIVAVFCQFCGSEFIGPSVKLADSSAGMSASMLGKFLKQ